MAGKEQNCSETSRNDLAAKQKSNLTMLSRVLKSQTSSIQHRACPGIQKKPSGGLKIFFLKALIGGAAIYLTASLGVWAEAEESTKIYSKFKQAVCKLDHENMVSSNVRVNLFEKVNKSKEFLKGHLENVPGELKVYYEKTENYINEFFKGKKS